MNRVNNLDRARGNPSGSIIHSSSANATGELFICFTSRLSSSSMKISSKSILSPGHSRDSSQVSLSTSLSRRLRNSGSLKGGQASPMFPTGVKKRGVAFENPEPSSPKVTCIGQIRTKTKKQGKKMRTRSRKMASEASFRTESQFQIQNTRPDGFPAHRNQRWVHLPLTICEALRGFGTELRCFFPCRSSEREREEKTERSGKSSSCGTVFARWLVSVQDEEGKEREIELVVGEEENGGRRRNVFEGMEFKEGEDKGEIVEAEGRRVSICIPPKNALLLMRCRSDPVKMAALANRFWESPAPVIADNVEEEVEEEEQCETEGAAVDMEREENALTEMQIRDKEENLILQEEEDIKEKESPLKEEEEIEEVAMEKTEMEETLETNQPGCAEEVASPDDCLSSEEMLDPEKLEFEENAENDEEEQVKGEEEEKEEDGSEREPEEKIQISAITEALEESTEEERKATQERSESEDPNPATEEAGPAKEEEEGEKSLKQEKRSSVLPDCLLLMMISEPKLSMEVSKETWVCSTDFIRRPPETEKKKKKKPIEKTNSGEESAKRVSVDKKFERSKQPLLQPARSSCSLPAPTGRVAGATITPAKDQKLVNGKAYEPFVLTRCKSEPMSSAAKLAPEACFWKNGKLEPPPPATLGVGF